MKTDKKPIMGKRKALLITSLALFGFSLTQNAFAAAHFDGPERYSGLAALLVGATIILGGGLLEWIVWLANPLFALSIFLAFRRDKRAVLPSLGSVVLSTSFMFWREILVSESGRTGAILSKGLGYYAWIAALVVWTSSFFLPIKK